ncbi:hypothetical protein SISNIDRAFT_491653 [Sistotremastrum niveocremeum HHB9708]|uniref:Uncharacterized protein n=1 Tax=Sistotremastrum niveocremeum HHB9708 TaxID=1314777 RepID=A0A164MJE8_9AGAM|nr:hypothetical protein SISNIDRAFT_491653 [Sistotremastrum niveocremeum HHB9708]
MDTALPSTSTSSYDYWWPYPPGGVTTTLPPTSIADPSLTSATLTSPVLVGPSTTTSLSSLLVSPPSPSDSTFLSTNTIASISTSSSTSLSTSTLADNTTSPSLIQITASIPTASLSPPPSNNALSSSFKPIYLLPVSTFLGAILGALTAYYCMNCCARRRARKGAYTRSPVNDIDADKIRSRSGSFDAGDWSVLEKGVERGLFSPREKVDTRGYPRVNRVGLGVGLNGDRNHDEIPSIDVEDHDDVQGTPRSFGPYTHEPSINVSTSPSKSWLSRAISSRQKSGPKKYQLSDPSRPSPSVYAPTQYQTTPLPPGAQAPYTPYSLAILSEDEEDDYQNIGNADTMRRTKSLRRGLIEKLGLSSNPRRSEKVGEGWTQVSLGEQETGDIGSPTNRDISGLRRNKSAGTPRPSHARADSNVTVSPHSPKKKAPMTYSPGTALKSPIPGQPSLTGDPIRPLASTFKTRRALASEEKSQEKDESKGWGQSWKKGGLAETMKRIAVEKASQIVSSASSAFISSSAPAAQGSDSHEDSIPSPVKANGESMFKEEFSPLIPPPPVLRAGEPERRSVLPRSPASVHSPPLENALTFTSPDIGTQRNEVINSRRTLLGSGKKGVGVLPRTSGPRPISRLNSVHASTSSGTPSNRSGESGSRSSGTGSTPSAHPSTSTSDSHNSYTSNKRNVRPTSPKARYEARRNALEEVDEILKSSWSARSLSEMAQPGTSANGPYGSAAAGVGMSRGRPGVVDSPTGFGARIV